MYIDNRGLCRSTLPLSVEALVESSVASLVSPTSTTVDYSNATAYVTLQNDRAVESSSLYIHAIKTLYVQYNLMTGIQSETGGKLLFCSSSSFLAIAKALVRVVSAADVACATTQIVSSAVLALEIENEFL